MKYFAHDFSSCVVPFNTKTQLFKMSTIYFKPWTVDYYIVVFQNQPTSIITYGFHCMCFIVSPHLSISKYYWNPRIAQHDTNDDDYDDDALAAMLFFVFLNSFMSYIHTICVLLLLLLLWSGLRGSIDNLTIHLEQRRCDDQENTSCIDKQYKCNLASNI